MDTTTIHIPPTNHDAAIAAAVALLRAGDVVAFPTETVYGLGACALRASAVQKIFAAKDRPPDNPLIVHVADTTMAAKYASEIPSSAKRLMAKFWPGPLSLVVPRSAVVPTVVTAGLDSVVLRCPSHPVAHALIRQLGEPIAAPSANRSGRVSPTTAEHVYEDLGGRIPLILDAGPVSGGIESTVLDCTTTPPTLLRPGSVTAEELEAVIGPIHSNKQSTTARAPGMKYRHYSPTAKLLLLSPGANWKSVLAAVDPDTSRVIYHTTAPDGFATSKLPADPAAAAPQLFATLRAVDTPTTQTIVVEGWDSHGIGAALMNRLEKAASRVMY